MSRHPRRDSIVDANDEVIVSPFSHAAPVGTVGTPPSPTSHSPTELLSSFGGRSPSNPTTTSSSSATAHNLSITPPAVVNAEGSGTPQVSPPYYLGVKNTFLHAERGVRDSLLAYDHVSRSAPTPDLQTSPISSDGFGGLLAPGFGPSANANQAASGLLWPAASVFDAPAASGGASGEHSSPLSSSPLMQQFQSMQNFQQQQRQALLLQQQQAQLIEHQRQLLLMQEEQRRLYMQQQVSSSSPSTSAFPPLPSSSAAASNQQAVEDAVVARYVAAGASSLRSSADNVPSESAEPNAEHRRRTASLGPGMLSTANIAGGVGGGGGGGGGVRGASSGAAVNGGGSGGGSPPQTSAGAAGFTSAAAAAASSAGGAATALSSSSGNSGGGYAAAANRRGKAMNTERMQLDVDAIESGEDKRTTLMVKNIPNKYSQRMLIEAFEDSAGLFDFLYLPIDFSNRCFPEHDHQLLTSDGFMFLDEVEARVEMHRGCVTDWRGLKVATYDERTRQLVYRQPRELVVNEPGAALLELGSMPPLSLCGGAGARDAVSVVATRNHELLVRAVDAGDAPFRKVSCDELLSSGVKQVRMLAAAAGGVAVPAGRAGAVLVGDVPLELYGFCVGSGFAVERVEPASCVVVSVRDADARRYLDSRLAAAEFVAGVDYEVDGAVYTMWRAALVQACLSTPADAFADAIVTACDLAALRRLLSGLCGARGTTRHFDTESVRLRDELVRVLLHAGFVATFEPLVVGASVGWRVHFGDDAQQAEPRVAVSREYKCATRSWCFDMSSGAPSELGDNANDGFVVVRRAHRVARTRVAGLSAMLLAHAKALSGDVAFVDETGEPVSRAALVAAHEAELAAYVAASDNGADDGIVVHATRPTIQGNCNVGYAFINFTSFKHIPAFFNKFHGRSWPKFNSVKICALAYARIQGKQSLITHFQNSRLLSEEKKCRPIIFGLDADGVATIEEQWPSADATPNRRGGGGSGGGGGGAASASSAGSNVNGSGSGVSSNSSSSSSSSSNSSSGGAGVAAGDSARNRRAGGRGRRGGGGSGGGGGSQ